MLHGIGIGYADPDLLGHEATKREKDAVVLRYSQLKQFLKANPEGCGKIEGDAQNRV